MYRAGTYSTLVITLYPKLEMLLMVTQGRLVVEQNSRYYFYLKQFYPAQFTRSTKICGNAGSRVTFM